MITILDCYTDEPAGLGVPPYLGTYPRYIAGHFLLEDEKVDYITIDDLRAYIKYGLQIPDKEKKQITDIKIYNLSVNYNNIKKILGNSEKLIIISGVHTPGKYLSAVPGTLKEIINILKNVENKNILDKNIEKILTGPAVFGTSSEGGRFSEKADLRFFDKIERFDFSYEEIKEYAVRGAEIIKQIPDLRIIEIETARGCSRAIHCSFCTEPIKHKISFRKKDDIVKEIKEFNKLGIEYFRLGKQSDYYSHPEAIEILKEIREKCRIKVLHIDNVNPANVIGKKGEEITKAIVKYCTEGNIAAFGAESFDPNVVKENNLNSYAETTYEAVKILNKYGSERGPNGMPKFLPGINILFGLIGETKETNLHNMKWLKRMLDENLLIRRINIRQVDIFEGTPLYNSVGNKFIKKNKKFYWKWRNEIRQEIDFPMLKKIAPEGTIMRDLRTEVYDGNTTFARQIGTYPLIVGIKGRLELGKFINVRVKGHMLRSLVGEIL